MKVIKMWLIKYNGQVKLVYETDGKLDIKGYGVFYTYESSYGAILPLSKEGFEKGIKEML